MSLEKLPVLLAVDTLQLNNLNMSADYANNIGNVVSGYGLASFEPDRVSQGKIFSSAVANLPCYTTHLKRGVELYHDHRDRVLVNQNSGKRGSTRFSPQLGVVCPDKVVDLLYCDRAKRIDQEMEAIRKALQESFFGMDHAQIWERTLTVYELIHGDDSHFMMDASSALDGYFTELGIK